MIRYPQHNDFFITEKAINEGSGLFSGFNLAHIAWFDFEPDPAGIKVWLTSHKYSPVIIRGQDAIRLMYAMGLEPNVSVYSKRKELIYNTYGDNPPEPDEPDTFFDNL